MTIKWQVWASGKDAAGQVLPAVHGVVFPTRAGGQHGARDPKNQHGQRGAAAEEPGHQ